MGRFVYPMNVSLDLRIEQVPETTARASGCASARNCTASSTPGRGSSP